MLLITINKTQSFSTVKSEIMLAHKLIKQRTDWKHLQEVKQVTAILRIKTNENKQVHEFCMLNKFENCVRHTWTVCIFDIEFWKKGIWDVPFKSVDIIYLGVFVIALYTLCVCICQWYWLQLEIYGLLKLSKNRHLLLFKKHC